MTTAAHDREDKERAEKVRMIVLHFDNTLAIVDSLPRRAQLRALTLILDKLTAKLLTLGPK